MHCMYVYLSDISIDRAEHGKEVGLSEHVHLGHQERLRQPGHLLLSPGGSPSDEEQTGLIPPPLLLLLLLMLTMMLLL